MWGKACVGVVVPEGIMAHERLNFHSVHVCDHQIKRACVFVLQKCKRMGQMLATTFATFAHSVNNDCRRETTSPFIRFGSSVGQHLGGLPAKMLAFSCWWRPAISILRACRIGATNVFEFLAAGPDKV